MSFFKRKKKDHIYYVALFNMLLYLQFPIIKLESMLLGTEMIIGFISFAEFLLYCLSFLSIYNAIIWLTDVFGSHLAAIQYFFCVLFQSFDFHSGLENDIMY